MGMTGKRSDPTSIFSTARSPRGSTSRTRAGNSRRSERATVISRPPSTTWLLVTMIPSDRTITPDPREPSTRLGGTPMPNICQKGSTCWRTTRLAEMFTTAGAARRTTGAKEAFMFRASEGAARVGWARGGGWASDRLVGPEQAASRTKAGTKSRCRRMGFLMGRAL